MITLRRKMLVAHSFVNMVQGLDSSNLYETVPNPHKVGEYIHLREFVDSDYLFECSESTERNIVDIVSDLKQYIDLGRMWVDWGIEDGIVKSKGRMSYDVVQKDQRGRGRKKDPMKWVVKTLDKQFSNPTAREVAAGVNYCWSDDGEQLYFEISFPLLEMYKLNNKTTAILLFFLLSQDRWW